MEKVKRAASCECEEDPLSFLQNSTPRGLGVTPKQFETLMGGAEGNLSPDKVFALLERYQIENRNKEKVDRQKENEQQMGHKFHTVRKPTEEILRGAKLMYPNATQDCSAPSILNKSGEGTRKANRGNIKFSNEPEECRYYVPGSRSRPSPDEMEESPGCQVSPPCEKQPAPGSPRGRNYENYDATDILARGVCPPINQPRVPARFLESRCSGGNAEQEDPEMQKIRGRGVWPQPVSRIPDRFVGPRPEPDPAACGCMPPSYQRIPDRFLPKASQQSTLETYTGQKTLPDRFLRNNPSLEYEEWEQPQLCSFKPGKQRIPDRFMSHVTPPKRERPQCNRGRSVDYQCNTAQDDAVDDVDNACLSNYLNYSKETYPRATDSDLDEDENQNSCAVEGTKPKYWF